MCRFVLASVLAAFDLASTALAADEELSQEMVLMALGGTGGFPPCTCAGHLLLVGANGRDENAGGCVPQLGGGHLGTTLASAADLLGDGGTALCAGGCNAVNAGEVRIFGRDAAGRSVAGGQYVIRARPGFRGASRCFSLVR